ncbi:MAG: DUF5131 family protein [Spirulina sp.]
MGKTAISWTDYTDNPIFLSRGATGGNGGHWCRKISPGCANCYAEAVNQSGFFAFASHRPYTGEAPDDLFFDEAIPKAWSKKRRPAKRFVCSMTDLCGEWVPRSWQYAVLDAAVTAPSQTIQLLTKRPGIALRATMDWCRLNNRDRLPTNVWLGCTVEDQTCANVRREFMERLAEYCAVVWASYEPALERVNWQGWEFLSWLVIGGESGPKARPFDLDWAEQAITWCRSNKVAPFMKQTGSRPTRGGLTFQVTAKGTDPNEWPEPLQVQQFPTLEG